MKVQFVTFGDNIASSRLRASIPQAHCGLEYGDDIVVYGKHVVPMDYVQKFKKRVFDVCDDHFDTHPYYAEHCKSAHAVTCNSEMMAHIIYTRTGVSAHVIPDPYETDRQPAGKGEGICWYGHQSNIQDLMDSGLQDVTVLTGKAWSLQKQRNMIRSHAVVVIPTGKKIAKSANRLIEGVQNGRFVVAGHLPAYEEFAKWMYVGDIQNGLQWFYDNPDKAMDAILDCQDYIEEKYSPEVIGKKWKNLLQTL